MDTPANAETNRTGLHRHRIARYLIVCVALMLTPLMTKPAIAAPDDDVRATFERFVSAQNAHDIKAVETLLLASPSFLWITRGTPVWGHEAALKRFAGLYEGTWRLELEASDLKIIMIGEGIAQVYVPIAFTIGAPGQPAQPARFLMNLVLVKTPGGGWKVSSLLPIPAPAQ
jgi:ketosteroid isomerase-like protein